MQRDEEEEEKEDEHSPSNIFSFKFLLL